MSIDPTARLTATSPAATRSCVTHILAHPLAGPLTVRITAYDRPAARSFVPSIEVNTASPRGLHMKGWCVRRHQALAAGVDGKRPAAAAAAVVVTPRRGTDVIEHAPTIRTGITLTAANSPRRPRRPP